MTKAGVEYSYRDEYGNPAMVNGNFNQEEADSATRLAEETALSVRGLTAEVISYTGDYVKVKWYKDKKPYQVFKMKAYDQARFLSFINAIADEDGLAPDAP